MSEERLEISEERGYQRILEELGGSRKRGAFSEERLEISEERGCQRILEELGGARKRGTIRD